MDMDLVLDVGNSRTKAALFGNGRLLRWVVLPNGDRGGLLELLQGVDPEQAVMGSVAAEDPALVAWLAQRCPVLEVRGTTPSPLRMGYSSPETLGADRLANAVGAIRWFPGRAALVIDLGTCITYDLVESDGTFAGGAISPGLMMRAQAMHAHSARLPLVIPAEGSGPLGRTTQQALEAGIHHGILGELFGFISAYRQQRPDMGVILTGGDALRFARGLKSGIFAHPLLTLKGLHAILEHHRALSGMAPGISGQRGHGPGAAG